ncbi:hypothetical protein MLD38_020119 [Melastoma candidum]|uniref:Uncharacterized protein n=1 Tax=Melastoma candidum TaxID=119954 RepID=A0ACB9QC54_9MYRT|nr:hypothetical protein MLD38_020119 [Melastoma candidum]
MEEAAKSSSQLQQRQLLQQQFLLLQHLQKQQQQAAAVSQFPLNVDAHLWTPGNTYRPVQPNVVPNVLHQHHQQRPHQQAQPEHPNQLQNLQQQQLQQKVIRHGKQLEFQMARQDAWHVCCPDFNHPFSSLEDACERLLPYHVVADYEMEEDDRILDSDPKGQPLSRSQQWDHNISAKVAEFTSTFEKQVMAFNMISRKRAQGEFRSEERLMVEQTLSREEKLAMMEVRTEIESRERGGRDGC